MKTPALDDSVLGYVGSTVFVRCDYGWGWRGNGNAPEAAEDFEMEVIRFWNGDAPRRGGIGRVISENHELAKHWVIFDVRCEGIYNFDSGIGPFNLIFGSQEPDDERNGWPFFSQKIRTCSGFGEIMNREKGFQQSAPGKVG